MAGLGQTYRNADVPEEALIPKGTEAILQVVDSSVDDTKKLDGKILKLMIRVMNGPFEGRILWERLNISNPNATAQGIALRQLAQLADAVGLAEVSDSEQLHGRPFRGTIGIREDKSGSFPPQNVITKYRSAGGSPGAPAPAPRQQPRPQARPNGGPAPQPGASRPWGRQSAPASSFDDEIPF